MRVLRIVSALLAMLCAACGVEKGAALTGAPGATDGVSVGSGALKFSHIAVVGDEIYAIAGGTAIAHVPASGAEPTVVKTSPAGSVFLDVAAGVDRVVYTQALASDPAMAQVYWTRLDGQGGSTIGAPFVRSGRVPLLAIGSVYYAVHGTSIVEWDSAANIVKTSEFSAEFAGALAAAGKLFVAIGETTGTNNGVYAADTAKSPPTLDAVLLDPFSTNASAVADTFRYAAAGKIFGYDAAAKATILPFAAAGAVAAIGDAAGVYWLSGAGKFAVTFRGLDGKDVAVGEAVCLEIPPRLLLTSKKVFVDCDNQATGFERVR